MSRRVTKEHQENIAPQLREIKGAIRRFAIKVTSRVLWQLVGHRTDDGFETFDAEVFSGIGIYARPRSSDRAEAIVLSVGGAHHPVIVATRNEDVRKVMALLAADETAVFNSQATVHIVGNEVHVRTAAGVAVPLMTAAEHNSHTHPYVDNVDGGTNVNKTTSTPSSPATGTSCIKGH